MGTSLRLGIVAGVSAEERGGWEANGQGGENVRTVEMTTQLSMSAMMWSASWAKAPRRSLLGKLESECWTGAGRSLLNRYGNIAEKFITSDLIGDQGINIQLSVMDHGTLESTQK